MFITLQETTFQNPKNDFSCSHYVYQIFYKIKKKKKKKKKKKTNEIKEVHFHGDRSSTCIDMQI